MYNHCKIVHVQSNINVYMLDWPLTFIYFGLFTLEYSLRTMGQFGAILTLCKQHVIGHFSYIR